MMNTLSLFPRKTAQPPLVGNTARTCTSITVLFIPGERYPQGEEKQAARKSVNNFLDNLLTLFLIVSRAE
jgi:hypothetical protein